eukprot:s1696_g10.t2
MVQILQEAIPREHLPLHGIQMSDQTHLTGLVRGAKKHFKTRVGKWIQIAELTDVMWSARKVNIGTRSLLSLCASDNTGRFILAGHPTADPRSEFIDTGIWPTWISASHGHNQKIASQIDDSGIALAWLTGEERDVLGDTAAFQGRPYLAKGEYPPRLYHRTTHDAAFSIIDTGFQPGYGSSGKIHSYFAKATLSELENRAGSRANLPYELVISTDEALQHAYMFETTSEGILTRDVILGSCILYVRDTMKGTIIWTRADPDDAEEVIATDAPPQTIIENPEEDDGIFSESLEGIPAPPSGGLEEQQVTKEEIAPGIAKPELPAILDATAADVLPKEESVLDQDQGEQPATPVSRKRGAEEVLYDCEDDDDDELDYGGGIGDMKEEISTMRHRASRQLRRRPKQLENQGASSLCTRRLRRRNNSSSKRRRRASFASILDRFDNDVDFTLHSVAGGFDREFLAIEDVLTNSALPNLGRGQEQRTLGVGAYGGGQQAEMARNEAIARLLYMHDVNPAALRAGLIDTVTDLPFCIMWLGGTYSVRKFVDVFLQHKIAKQIVMFSGGPIYLDHTAGYTAEQWYEWIVTRLHDQTALRANCLRCNQEAAMLLFRAQSMAVAARRAPMRWQRQQQQVAPVARPSQALFGPVRCFSEKVTGGHPEFQDKTMNEAARARQPRAPLLIVSAMCVAMMFWWAPALFSAVALGSWLGEDSTHKAFAVGGQSERGDAKREQMKREYAERQAREQAAKTALNLVDCYWGSRALQSRQSVWRDLMPGHDRLSRSRSASGRRRRRRRRNPRLNFGRHSGMSYREVARNHPGYVRWALSQPSPTGGLRSFVAWLRAHPPDDARHEVTGVDLRLDLIESEAIVIKMDFSEGFSDGEPEVCAHEGHEMDLTAAFSDDDPSTTPAGPGISDHEAEASILALPVAPEAQAAVIRRSASGSGVSLDRKGYCLRGKVGSGRHGGSIERNMVCAHMRAEKRAKKEHTSREELVNALQDATFIKDGQSFTVSAKPGQTGGLKIVMQKQAGRGNRFVRKIAFAKFVRAAFGMNTSNVALSALLNVDASTIPRLQKTCAGVFMASQTRLLARILFYCQRNKPLSVHRQFKWDESTISTTLNPGGVSQPVQSAWSMLVARARLLITWSSGATLLMRVVLPTIPLISSTAQQIYYGIRHHPSYYAVNHMLDLIDATAEIRCTVQEMDGAYANLRLHHHMLSLKEYNPEEPGGAYLATARCQSHATHLISVSMLALIGGNLLARLYGLCVFLRNLGYLLRLQLALKQWLEATWIL